MSKTKLKLRPAQYQDSRLIWRWRNEPSGLKNYFSARPVRWDAHQKWFSAKQKNPKSHLFVIENQKKPVGQIRMEINGRGKGEVHISLDKKARGQGLGSKGIKALTNKFLKKGSTKFIVAHIKPQNVPSVMAFLKAGFYFKRWVKIKGVHCYQMVKDQL